MLSFEFPVFLHGIGPMRFLSPHRHTRGWSLFFSLQVALVSTPGAEGRSGRAGEGIEGTVGEDRAVGGAGGTWGPGCVPAHSDRTVATTDLPSCQSTLASAGLWFLRGLVRGVCFCAASGGAHWPHPGVRATHASRAGQGQSLGGFSALTTLASSGSPEGLSSGRGRET